MDGFVFLSAAAHIFHFSLMPATNFLFTTAQTHEHRTPDFQILGTLKAILNFNALFLLANICHSYTGDLLASECLFTLSLFEVSSLVNKMNVCNHLDGTQTSDALMFPLCALYHHLPLMTVWKSQHTLTHTLPASLPCGHSPTNTWSSSQINCKHIVGSQLK